MQRHLSGHLTGWLAILAAVAVAAACVPSYRPPTRDEPHAVVKFRRSYDLTPGVTLREVVDVDGTRAYSVASPAGLGRAPRTDVVLVHVTTMTVEVQTRFSHTELKTVQETYTEQVPHYTTETYDCSTGFGTNRTYRTCTRPATKYRTETKHRWVTKPVEVSDGSCRASLRFTAAEQHVYLLQYSYQDSGVCRLSCFEQVFIASGKFEHKACELRSEEH